MGQQWKHLFWAQETLHVEMLNKFLPVSSTHALALAKSSDYRIAFYICEQAIWVEQYWWYILPQDVWQKVYAPRSFQGELYERCEMSLVMCSSFPLKIIFLFVETLEENIWKITQTQKTLSEIIIEAFISFNCMQLKKKSSVSSPEISTFLFILGEKKGTETGVQATVAKTPICDHIAVTLSALTALLPSQVKHVCHSPFCLQIHARIIPPVLYLALILLAWKMETLGPLELCLHFQHLTGYPPPANNSFPSKCYIFTSGRDVFGRLF